MLSSISFWGSIASIVALLYGIISFLVGRISFYNKDLEKSKKRIVESLRSLEAEALNATTQARRTDLYIYKESVLTEARHRLTMRKLEIVIYVVFMGVLFLFLVTADMSSQNTAMGLATKEMASLTEGIEISNPVTLFSEEKVGLLMFILYIVLLIILWLELKEVKSIQKRISDISSIFINSFELLLNKNYKSDLTLSSEMKKTS